jgi:hypothetical protein
MDVPPGHKRCPGCGEIKPHAEWHRNSTTKDGYAAYCKSCRREQGRADHLRRNFGLTTAEAEALFDSQGGLCAICRTAEIKHIDHDHGTDKVRGGLCGPCNMGLGQFRDDPDLLVAAAWYLKRHGRPVTTCPEPIFKECYPARGPIVFELADDYPHAA